MSTQNYWVNSNDPFSLHNKELFQPFSDFNRIQQKMANFIKLFFAILSLSSGLYYKPITIVNGDSRVVNKLETSLNDDARAIIYDRHVFIVQATGSSVGIRTRNLRIMLYFYSYPNLAKLSCNVIHPLA
jgi:hypothetical protein